MDKRKIYLWPDKSWASEEDIDDMDWFLASSDKDDDYVEYEIPIELDEKDIEELIELNALPGMLPDKKDFISGTVPIALNDIMVIKYPPGTLMTVLEDRLVITIVKDVSIEILKGQ